MSTRRWPILLLGTFAVALAIALAISTLYRCSPRPPKLSGELRTLALTAGGRDRTLSFYRPASALQRPALLFALHGSKGDGEQMRRLFTGYGFDQLADQAGFIVVYPDGYERHWNDCRISADFAANTENIDDIAFFRAMVDYFVREHGVDPARIYATGISNGCHMVYRLGYEMPEVFAALAPVAANLPVAANSDCNPAGQPVSMAIFNGTDDPINPYRGGLVEMLGDTSRGNVLSADDSAAYWAGLAHAGAAATTRYPELDGDERTWVERSTWRGDGAEVRLYALHGAGHLLPMRSPGIVARALSRPLGGLATDLEGTAEIWDFFTSQRSRPAAVADPIAAGQ